MQNAVMQPTDCTSIMSVWSTWTVCTLVVVNEKMFAALTGNKVKKKKAE